LEKRIIKIEKELICEIVIPDYPDKVLISNKINPKYYKSQTSTSRGVKATKKFYEKNTLKKNVLGKEVVISTSRLKPNFKFDEKGYLIDLTTNEKIISNIYKVGKPNYFVINFQPIYNQFIQYEARNNIVLKLSKIFKPYIENINVINEFPISIDKFIISPEMPIDVDNKFALYTKVITDLLVKEGKVPDDKALFINDNGRGKWIKSENKNDMVIRIYKSDNNIK
jgi:hypothetical protein